MQRALGWFAIGLAVGVVVTVLLKPSARVTDTVEPNLAATDAGNVIPNLTIQEHEELVEYVSVLEARIDELAAELRENESALARAEGVVAVQPLPPSPAPSEQPQDIAERLAAGGLAPDRAEWIANRSEALLMAQIEARHAAEREGEPLSLEALERLGPQYKLREELGDWDYEQYLQALGRPTTVGIPSVLANSPAARAGLESGDQIVAYDGDRVFNVFEVTEATRQGTAGESVIVDVIRNGQPMQFIVPRGPLGVALDGNGLPSATIVMPSAGGE